MVSDCDLSRAFFSHEIAFEQSTYGIFSLDLFKPNLPGKKIKSFVKMIAIISIAMLRHRDQYLPRPLA
jgi:hypothetical protein